MPRVSVIIPVYKVEPYIHRCIDSILLQTFIDYELILIDDGSPDNCGAICDEYAKQDNRLTVIHQNNQGLWGARNTGLDWIFANSDSEWVTFLDSDDWVHPRYLELLFRAVTENGVNISQCLSIRTSGQEKLPEVEERIICIDAEDGYINHYTSVAWGKIYRKDCFQSIRYPNLPISEDTAIWHRIIYGEEQIAIVKEVLYYYYVNPKSITNSRWDLQCTVSLDVYRDCVEYFKQHKRWTKALLFQKKQYVLHISYLYYALLHADVEDVKKKFYLCTLKNEMRSALRKYGREIKLSFREYPGVYETAFPELMRYYWFFRNRMVKQKGK